MGYDSNISGVVHMSRAAWDRLRVSKVKLENGEELEPFGAVSPFFDEAEYNDGSASLTIDSCGHHYEYAEVFMHISRFKDTDNVDNVLYIGSDSGDRLNIIIFRGHYICINPIYLTDCVLEYITNNDMWSSVLVAHRLSGDPLFYEQMLEIVFSRIGGA